MKPRPYVSIDIETTGISDRSHIIEIGAVYEDWVTPVAELPRTRIPVAWNFFEYAEPYALFLNAKLIEDIARNRIESFSPGNAASHLLTFLNLCHTNISHWDTENGLDKQLKGKIQFAGKNVAGFDIPKLQLFFEALSPGKPATAANKGTPGFFTSAFNAVKMHRSIDTGSVYFTEFGYVPNLTQINTVNRRSEVAHTAIEDAIDVIVANRRKAGYKI